MTKKKDFILLTTLKFASILALIYSRWETQKIMKDFNEVYNS